MFSEKNKLFIGYIDPANCLTFCGVLFAFLACYYADKNLPLCMTLFILAGICDLFDGAAARKIKRTDKEKAFGLQLDTVADTVSFCTVPAYIVYVHNAGNTIALAVCFLYILCGITRLAYFSASSSADMPVKYYTGLPVTYIALILPVTMLFTPPALQMAVLSITALLFVLNIKIPKLKGIWYLLFSAAAAGMIILWWCL